MLENKDYCDYDTYVALEELGYPEVMAFNKPFLLYEVQKWLREEKNIDILIELEIKDIHLSSKYYSIHISYMSRFRREFKYVLKTFDSYEEALAEGIKGAVKILKEYETILR